MLYLASTLFETDNTCRLISFIFSWFICNLFYLAMGYMNFQRLYLAPRRRIRLPV